MLLLYLTKLPSSNCYLASHLKDLKLAFLYLNPVTLKQILIVHTDLGSSINWLIKSNQGRFSKTNVYYHFIENINLCLIVAEDLELFCHIGIKTVTSVCPLVLNLFRMKHGP